MSLINAEQDRSEVGSSLDSELILEVLRIGIEGSYFNLEGSSLK